MRQIAGNGDGGAVLSTSTTTYGATAPPSFRRTVEPPSPTSSTDEAVSPRYASTTSAPRTPRTDSTRYKYTPSGQLAN
ncbi:hypothetical protein [Streptomyces clavuligerus]|uniref:hypothetical protein n=1 Tax=Streptomyces clavuligerus TaxID=1901 RepID=UPI0013C4F692|nr:hypothetical protein [Streptomyces clavuligerus]